VSDDELLTTGEAAALLKITPQTAARMAKAGRLRAKRLPGGTHWRIWRSAVDEALEGGDHGDPR
jgi:excisionase family DNA binding protein